MKPEQWTKEVSVMLDRVNGKLFGNSYKRRKKVFLGTYAVLEQTINDGWHAHILVGVPEDALSVKTNPFRGKVPDLIIDTWLSLDRDRRDPKAQDIQLVTAIDGCFAYILKDIHSILDFDQVDVLNTNFSTHPAARA